MLFDAICRQNGIEHLLPQPRSPNTTGKIERFHRSLRAEFLSNRTAFTNLKVAQQASDDGSNLYNTARPHHALQISTPAQRFTARPSMTPIAAPTPLGHDERRDSDWASRRDHYQRCGVRLEEGPARSSSAAASVPVKKCSVRGSRYSEAKS